MIKKAWRKHNEAVKVFAAGYVGEMIEREGEIHHQHDWFS
jgi:hypothetical protein